MIFPLAQLCRPILFIQAGQKILIETHLFFHKILLYFINDPKVWNSFSMIMHRVPYLVEDEIKSLQCIPEFFFCYKVPMGNAKSFADLIHFFIQSQNNVRLQPQVVFFSLFIKIETSTFIYFNIGFHTMQTISFSSTIISADCKTGNFSDIF